MNDFTGRRKSDRAKRFGKGLLEGLSALGTVMADGPKRERIAEIDEQIKELQQERDHLITELIEPGDLKVSEGYDPKWSKSPRTEPLMDQFFGAGTPRLVQCKGRSHSGTFHSAHPGCPYIDQIHNAHEFTLRD